MYLKWSINPQYNSQVIPIQNALNRAREVVSRENGNLVSWPNLKVDGYFGEITANALQTYRERAKNITGNKSYQYGIITEDDIVDQINQFITYIVTHSTNQGSTIGILQPQTLGQKIITNVRIRWEEFNKKMDYDLVSTISAIYGAITNLRPTDLEPFLAKKDWNGLCKYINHVIKSRFLSHDVRLTHLNQELYDAHIENERLKNIKAEQVKLPVSKRTEDLTKIDKQIRINDNIIRRNQSLIDKELHVQTIDKRYIKDAQWSPGKIFEKVKPLITKYTELEAKHPNLGKVRNGIGKVGKSTPYWQAIWIAKDWIIHFFPIEERSPQWEQENLKLQAKMFDALVQMLVTELIMIILIAIGFLATDTFIAIAITVVVGLVVSFIVGIISELIGIIVAGDSSKTFCEIVVLYANKQTDIYSNWANRQ